VQVTHFLVHFILNEVSSNLDGTILALKYQFVQELKHQAFRVFK